MRLSPLRLTIRHQEMQLAPGEMSTGTSEMLYRDAPDSTLHLIQADIVAGVPWREAARRHLAEVNPWLLRVITDPDRSRWLNLHPPAKGSWVLDVGCGWGQWAIPAASHAQVVALEPTPARLAITRAIAEQEGCAGSMFFVGSAVEEVEFPDRKFDHIYSIGVLEWVPKFRTDLDPLEAQRIFLRRLRGLLAEGGECIIGIENRLGLKYLLGARDDHTGVAGISLLDAATAARRYEALTQQPLRVFTYTMAEYQTLLTGAGFTQVEFFAAYPDYKVPQVILPIADGSANRHCLSGNFIPEHDGSNGERLKFQEELASHYRSLGELGVAGNFAPSFFIRAKL